MFTYDTPSIETEENLKFSFIGTIYTKQKMQM